MNVLPGKLARVAWSAANWFGLTAATVVLIAKGLGLIGSSGWALAAVGYAVGYVVGGMWFGYPAWKDDEWVTELQFDNVGDARQAMSAALNGIMALAAANPGGRLSGDVVRGTTELCQRLLDLLSQWERSKGSLPLQEDFHARQLAVSYLPEALKTYMSIPRSFATTKVLGNGRTAEETMLLALREMDGAVAKLGDDLARQDADAFLAHSRFLGQKFGSGSG